MDITGEERAAAVSMTVTYRLEPTATGTRLTFEHTGFAGVGGFLLAKLMMAPGRKKMLGKGVTAVLEELDDSGQLRSNSMLKPKCPAN